MKTNYQDIGDQKVNSSTFNKAFKKNPDKYKYIIDELEKNPFKSREILDSQAKERLSNILQHAYEETKFYKKNFDDKKVTPDSFVDLKDLSQFPVTEKTAFIHSKEEHYIAAKYWDELTYRTRTCGTSYGKGLNIHFDEDAIIHDTLQGVQQLILQSKQNEPSNKNNGSVNEDDVTLQYYPYQWWAGSINGSWKTDFISSDKEAKKVAQHIKGTRPSVLSGYPSVLRRLIPFLDKKNKKERYFKLIITNSEYSTKRERDFISEHFGCPVLDEYSSEELTRIALEMPDGNYYVNENSVYLEVVDPLTKKPVEDGIWGEAVVTSLLNKAMPFIRYATGDWVRKSPIQKATTQNLNWTKLSDIGGRITDGLLRTDNTAIPQNIILDQLDEKNFLDTTTTIEYRIYQKSHDQIAIVHKDGPKTSYEKSKEFLDNAKEILTKELGNCLEITTRKTKRSLFDFDRKLSRLPQKSSVGKKRRIIRFIGDPMAYEHYVGSLLT